MAEYIDNIDRFGAYVFGELKFYPWRHYKIKEQWLVKSFKKGRSEHEEYGVIAITPEEAVTRAKKLFLDQLQYEQEQREKYKRQQKEEQYGRTEGTTLRRILPKEHQLAS